MIFGIPKEVFSREFEERRAGLAPSGVRELTELGAEVYVESGAGERARFTDEVYREVGASIVYSKDEVYKRSDVVLKIRPPIPEEWDFLKSGQAIFGFLHVALAPDEFLNTFLGKEITCLGYEMVQHGDGRLPLLIPQSEIAGKMAVQIAGGLLESKKKGRRGILLGGLAGIPPAEVVILGGGTLGFAAALSFAGIGASVYVVDKNIERLDEIDRFTSGRVVTVVYNRRNLEKLVKFADVLVSSVLIPGSRAPMLVTEKMVQTMKKGAVILDFSIDQGGCVETSRPTPTQESVFVKHGVVHFAMTNVPSLVARTSCYALTNSVLPYLRLVARQGLDGALRESPELVRGVCTYRGFASRENLARGKYPFKPVEALLAEG